MFLRKKNICFLFFIFCCFILFSFRHSSTLTCKEVIQNTLAAIDKIQALKFHLKVCERFNGKLILSESHIKLMRSPRKVYIKLNGPELLWADGENDGKALVNPDGFPYINLNLDPFGSIMRNNQHHTVQDAGFDYFAGIIKNSLNIAGEKFDEYFKLVGTLNWEGRDCYYVTADYPYFNYVDYTVQKNETLVTIAAKLKVSDYMLLEINSDKVNNYRDVKEGQKIKVPNVYGKKMILYIDKELFLPLVMTVYDDKGLYESYEYHELEVNPKFAADEFSKKFKEYGF